MLLAAVGTATAAWAQDLAFSAKVDNTTVNIGDPIQLTVSLSGDISGIQLPALEFPEGFAIMARSQATNFSVRAGAMERSTSLTVILVPQHEGTFQLGPFSLQHQQRTLATEPIEVTVTKPAVPPRLEPHGGRFLL